MLRRLDAELVRRGLARSRDAASEMIDSGAVLVGGIVCQKSSRQVDEQVSIVVKTPAEEWVSRGAHKLIGALARFKPKGLELQGRHALDAGASTGGFTQVLLREGVADVAAVDVGYGQIAWALRTDERVHVIERFNVRNLTSADLPNPVDLVVADLSFISLRTVLPALQASATAAADFVLMVKPQFEVGREQIGDGVVRDLALRKSAVAGVVDAAQALGLGLRAVEASPLPGPEGNVEYFVWLKAGSNPRSQIQVAQLVAAAVEGGPA